MGTIIFGGSFDPIHLGHIKIANFARKALDVKRVLFIPSAQPFFEKPHYQSSAHDRMSMLEIALGAYPWAHMCMYELQEELEQKKPRQHFTVDTLRFLKEQNIVTGRPYLLMGQDQVAHLPQWKDIDILAHEVKFLFAMRGEHPPITIPYEFELLHNTPITCASSDIRKRIFLHKRLGNLVPKEVARYIKSHKIYQ